MMRKIALLLLVMVLFVPAGASAHHGGVSLAFGPGSPIETNSPLTLPEGGIVISSRFEHVFWRKFGFAEPENKDSFSFFNVGLSYGITPFLTGSIYFPYNIKRQDELGSLEGFGDIRCSMMLGFHYDPKRGWDLNRTEDTAVTLEGSGITFFSLSAGMTFPTGKWRERLGGEIDPGMQPGFGSPSFNIGLAASRQIWGAFSMAFDTGLDLYVERDDFRFGTEWRVNLAGIYEIFGDPDCFMSKLDGILELNYLNLGRDKEHGEGLDATGGDILYLTPGLRFSFSSLWNANLGLGVKIPVGHWLNEQEEQQGGEGLERVRVITTLSFFF